MSYILVMSKLKIFSPLSTLFTGGLRIGALGFSAFLISVLSLSAQASSIYKSQGDNGSFIYSDKKPRGDYELFSEPEKKRLAAPDEVKPEPEADELPETRELEAIKITTDSVKNEINQVYSGIYLRDNDIKGSLKVDFTIDQQGKVIDCQEDESGMTKPGFNGKVCEIIKTLNYGAVQLTVPITVNFSYSFTAL